MKNQIPDSTSLTLGQINRPLISNNTINVQTLPQLNPVDNVNEPSGFGPSTILSLSKDFTSAVLLNSSSTDGYRGIAEVSQYVGNTEVTNESNIGYRTAITYPSRDEKIASAPTAEIYLEGKADILILDETKAKNEEKKSYEIPQLNEANSIFALNEIEK